VCLAGQAQEELSMGHHKEEEGHMDVRMCEYVCAFLCVVSSGGHRRS